MIPRGRRQLVNCVKAAGSELSLRLRVIIHYAERRRPIEDPSPAETRQTSPSATSHIHNLNAAQGEKNLNTKLYIPSSALDGQTDTLIKHDCRIFQPQRGEQEGVVPEPELRFSAG